jgi:hypothetical protein
MDLGIIIGGLLSAIALLIVTPVLSFCVPSVNGIPILTGLSKGPLIVRFLEKDIAKGPHQIPTRMSRSTDIENPRFTQ